MELSISIMVAVKIEIEFNLWSFCFFIGICFVKITESWIMYLLIFAKHTASCNVK